MAALILSDVEIRQLLPMRACMDRMLQVLASLDAGRAQNPLRGVLRVAGARSLLGVMPGATEEPATLGLKAVAVFPENHGTRYDSHQGVVVLFDRAHGSVRAILDGSEITAIRTAAVSGVATEALARPDAGDLALLGSGVQAWTHLDAMLQARRIRRVRVYSRSAEHRAAFARRASAQHGIKVEAVDSAQQAVEGADIVCTVTASAEPVLQSEWIAAGTHLNVVGASVPRAREVDTATMLRARLFVDRRESTLNEAGDFLIPKAEGALDESHIRAELGSVLAGRAPGRTSADEVTLFKSLGLAVEDLAAADYAVRQAEARGIGTRVALGGIRHDAD
jgi:ornithine cyclodeaminase/alanine dehydrogenase-like protein (mu-crystallin family)